MLDTIFNDSDTIEVRCLHQDQVKLDNGKYDPTPKFFFLKKTSLRKKYKELKSLNDKGYNIYIGVNPRKGRSTKNVSTFRCLLVDLDNISVKDATFQLETAIEKYLIPSPSLTIMSGGGVHLYWRVKDNSIKTAEEYTILQKRLIQTMPNCDPKVHDAPRIIRLPGFINHKRGKIAEIISKNNAVYDLDEFSDLPKIVVQTPPRQQGVRFNKVESCEIGSCISTNKNGSLDRAIKYFSYRDGVGKGQRNSEAFRVAAACSNDFELSENEALTVLSAWNRKNTPPLDNNEIREVLSKAMRSVKAKGISGSKNRSISTRPVIESLEYKAPETKTPDNVVPINPKKPIRKADGANFEIVAEMVEEYILIIGTTDVWDIDNGLMMPAASLRLLYPREYKYWLQDYNRQTIMLENLVFKPNGIVKPGQINTFRGFNFKRDERNPDKIIAHIEMLCNNNEKLFYWLLSWMAIQVQRPGTKLATSVIMHGKQGTGKSMLWHCFGDMFGEYFYTINQNLLESNFNQWASRKTFVLAEEVLANRSKSKLKNVIKEMVTGGKIVIDQKYTKAWQEDCYMNMVFLSNNKLPMLLDVEDRRFTVIRCDNIQPEEYYIELENEIKDNGSNRLYNFLMNWDLNGFHAHTKPYKTQEKAELIALAKDSSKLFLDDYVTDSIINLPCVSAIRGELYDAYREWCRIGSYHVVMRVDFYATIRNDYPELTESVYSGQRIFTKEGLSPNPAAFSRNIKVFLKKLSANII